jgi:hypothetical protein
MTQRIAIDPYCELWNRGILSFLCGHFAPTASVELHGCDVGAGTAGLILCWELCRLWRVRVRAPISYQTGRHRDGFDGHRVLEANGWPGSMEPFLIRRL